MKKISEHFTSPLLSWFDRNGRKTLPWQDPRDPYRVWLSEIMLQQTQVSTVIPYFNRFTERFKNVHSLALGKEDDVLALWSGLGYYSRARNLHKTAKIIHETYHGEFPNTVDILKTLPGIGESTAAAIVSQAFNKPAAILDGNVKRVLSRYFLVAGYPEHASVKQKLWDYSNACTPETRCADFTQAIMDLGALCCTRKNPNCEACPLASTCLAKQTHQVEHYPEPKTQKKLPIKQEIFLILTNEANLIYLEKRPPVGIWGGLWCLPTLAINDCYKTYIEKKYNLHCLTSLKLSPLNHSFSHFKLYIQPIVIQTKSSQTTCNELPGQWFSPDTIMTLGIPKPIRIILKPPL